MQVVRNYSGKEVTRPVIQKLVDAAVQAPSAMNSQAGVRALPGAPAAQRLFLRQNLVLPSEFQPGIGSPCADARDARRLKASTFDDAGTLLVVYATPNGGQFAVGDCFLAAQNLMGLRRMAWALSSPIGFAQSWLTLRTSRRSSRSLIQYTAVFPVVLGYPAKTPEHPARKKPEMINWK